MSGSGIVAVVLAALASVAVLGAWIVVTRRRGRPAVATGPGSPRAVPTGPGALDADTVPAPRITAPAGDLPGDLAAPPGTVLLLQVSARYCADSRAARAVVVDVAGAPGTVVREIDIDHRPELTARLALRCTPTTVLYDGTGRERSRFAGVPRRAALAEALAAARAVV